MDFYGFTSPWQRNSQNEHSEPGCSTWDAALSSHSPPAQATSPPLQPPSPWTSAGLSWGSAAPPQLMHFTAHTPQYSHTSHVVHCKRKSDLDPVIPPKQFITEEKMAAHLNGLHISHEYTEHGDGAPSPGAASPDAQPEQMDVQEWLKGARTVVLSDEIKKLREEPLIPPSLLERLEKPCMSLLVWKPKEPLVPSDQHSDSDEDESSSPRNPSAVGRRRRGVLITEIGPDDEASMEMDM